MAVRKLCVGPLENNVYVVVCRRTRRAVIVDAAAEADRIVRACEDVDPVVIVTTHGHRDHVGAADEVADRLGVPVRIHAADGPASRLSTWEPLEDGDRIEFGAAELEAVHTPGHTPGATCFVTTGIVFTGDTLFPGGPGATGGDAARFTSIMGSLRSRLFGLPDATIVFPGHGLDTTIGAERPYLAEWEERGW